MVWSNVGVFLIFRRFKCRFKLSFIICEARFNILLESPLESDLSSCHSPCFFKWVCSPFHSSDCCLYIFGMLNTSYSCTCRLFPTKWSPYSFGCILKLAFSHSRWHYEIHKLCYFKLFTLRSHLLRPNGSILSPIISFFDGSHTRTIIRFPSNRRF